MAKQQGFTLIELLIVVIILTLLAAIVLPQFSSSTQSAKVTAITSNLSSFRSAIELYYQHHGVYPSAAKSTGASCPSGGTAGTGEADSGQAFIDQLTRYSNIAGETCTTTDAAFQYGPYLKIDSMPNNSITDVSTVLIVTTGALGLTSSVTNGGWKFDNITGQMIADHSSYDHY